MLEGTPTGSGTVTGHLQGDIRSGARREGDVMVHEWRRAILPASVWIGGLAIGAAVTAAGLTAWIARRAVMPSRTFQYDVRIRSVAADLTTITLQATLESVVPGHYGFWLAGQAGHIRVGQILETTPTSVTRNIEKVTFGDIHSGQRGRISGWYYVRPELLGLPVSSVAISTDGGSAPAWLFPANSDSDRWAIHVHGRGIGRQSGLRAVPVFRDNGFTNLIVSYRNDGDAPNSADARSGLGSTEWRDVDAAIEFGIAHGAREIVLSGWSMGGSIVLQTLTRSAHSSYIRGIVLDSPVIDWVNTMNYHAEIRHLPTVITRAALGTMGAPWGKRVTGLAAPIDLRAMDFVARADELTVPVLLMHSDDDRYVPPYASRALAAARPDIVTYVAFPLARHTKLWNYDTNRWNQAVADWLRTLKT